MNSKRMVYLSSLIVMFMFVRTLAAQDLSEGEKIYKMYCATCHGADLKGGMSGSLVDGNWEFGESDRHIERNIRDGIPSRGMAAYGAVLKDSQISNLIAFIRSEEKKAVPAEEPAKVIAEVIDTFDYDIQAEVFVEGLEIPWAIDFIDADTALITERPGRLRVVENGELRPEPVQGTPPVLHEGQGGMLDVAVDPEYADNGWIYLSYSHALDDAGGNRPPAMTRVVRGKLDGNHWIDQQVIYEAATEHYQGTRHHYGSRIVFDRDGLLYFSVGDRGHGIMSQDLSRPNGKVHRIHRDGSIPEDNPFVGREDALPTIWSYGHRNQQGMGFHPETDELWTTEHGPRGGDEVNLVRPGANYGWQVVTYGINYNGTPITDERSRPDMVSPVFYWTPSTGTCGADFYQGELFPKWNGHLLAGALKYEDVQLLDIAEDRVMHSEVIFKGHGRVRDVMTGPDGAVYVVLNSPGMVARLVPIESD